MAGTATTTWSTIMAAMCGKQEITDYGSAPNKFKALDGTECYLLQSINGSGRQMIPCGPCQLSLLPVSGKIYDGTYSSTIAFGNGSAAPDPDAANVANPITSGLSLSSFSNNGGVVSMAVTNTTSPDITIGEFGILGEVFSYGSVDNSFDSGDRRKALMYHHVFDEPLVLKANSGNTLNIVMRGTVSGSFELEVQ